MRSVVCGGTAAGAPTLFPVLWCDRPGFYWTREVLASFFFSFLRKSRFQSGYSTPKEEKSQPDKVSQRAIHAFRDGNSLVTIPCPSSLDASHLTSRAANAIAFRERL